MVAVTLLWLSATDYAEARRAWRSEADALGSAGYDAAASDGRYELGEAALTRVKHRSHVLGLGLLLALTGLAGLSGRNRANTARPSVSPGRALAVVWLDTGLCLALVALNLRFMPQGARLAATMTGALMPWLMATLLTAPVASGFTLAGLLLGTRIRDEAGRRPTPLRALAALLLLPVTLAGAIFGLPAHLALLVGKRHPGAHRVSVHLALLGLHGIRWRRGEVAA